MIDHSAEPWLGRHLHFVGIGGAGMSGLAIIANQLGAQVTGSDGSKSSNYFELLRSNGIGYTVGHNEQNVPEKAELVISSAISVDNPERKIAGRRGQRELHRADLLAELTRLKPTIAVAGTHGKSTTSAMVVHLLRECGVRPSFVVGAEVRLRADAEASGETKSSDEGRSLSETMSSDEGRSLSETKSSDEGRSSAEESTVNAFWDDGEWLVVEADESDRSLLKLSAKIAVLTNVELDHHTTYSSLEDVRNTFREFLDRAETCVVLDQPDLIELVSAGQNLVTFDSNRPMTNSVQLEFPGKHNVCNAQAAATVGELVGIPLDRCTQALKGFAGVGRRFDRVGKTDSGALVVDDYAHHPTEVRAAIEGAKSLTNDRVVAIFQPHLFSRTQHQAAEFGEALTHADLAIVTEIYPAREHAVDFPGVSGKDIVDAILDADLKRDGAMQEAASTATGMRDWASDKSGGTQLRFVADIDSIQRFLDEELDAGDICLTLGAGNIDSLARSLVSVENRHVGNRFASGEGAESSKGQSNKSQSSRDESSKDA